MKTVYWRPQKVNRRVLCGISLLSVCGLALVERTPVQATATLGEEKVAAAHLARRCMEAVKAERIRRGQPLTRVFDPAGSGMVGHAMTLTTSRPAKLEAKQTSINPNFAAAMVEMLNDAGVRPGDTVAVGWSGSFPAWNVSLSAAMETLNLRPIVVASVLSSQYGANDPEMLWVDMERMLHEQGLISFRSVAASVGGAADRGMGMSSEALALVRKGIERNDLPRIETTKQKRAIERRMEIYRKHSHGAPLKAYINVGGGVASTGGDESKQRYRPGLNRQAPDEALDTDCVMTRFMRGGTPVIHMSDAVRLARHYGFPDSPTVMPAVGTGKPFVQHTSRRWTAAGLLLLILVVLRAYVLTDWSGRARAWLANLAGRNQPAGLQLVEEPLTGPRLMA